jgi:hypothetical protein
MLDLVVLAVTIMVVVIPIAIRVPAMSVFIPPPMIPVPAALPHCSQLATPLFGLSALVAVMFDRFVQFVIGFRNPSLAIVVIGPQLRCARKHQKAGQCCQGKCLSEKTPVGIMPHRFFVSFGQHSTSESWPGTIASRGPHSIPAARWDPSPRMICMRRNLHFFSRHHRALLAGLVPGRLLIQSSQEQFRRGGRANPTMDYNLLRGGSFSVEPLVAIIIRAES